MSPSLRFLALTLVGWAGLRAATLGALPGAEIFRVDRSEAKAPAILPTQFPPIDPIAPAEANAAPNNFAPASLPDSSSAAPARNARPVFVPVYYGPASAPAQMILPPVRRLAGALPEPTPAIYASLPLYDQSPLSRLAAAGASPLRSGPISTPKTAAQLKKNGIDRLQLSAWAMLRAQQAGLAGSHSLAPEGQLGASQAGARLVYNFTRQVSASLRTSSEVGRRGGEIAGGVRIQPARAIPLWFTAERRQRIGRYGDGRNAFAMFAEAGLYQRPMPLRFSLDAYLQGGVVGMHRRDYFVDGALTLTRPVYKQFSAGFGVWGAAQPGIYRFDAGPRVSMQVRSNVRVHFDWRQRLLGNARPGSGAAVTLAGDF